MFAVWFMAEPAPFYFSYFLFFWPQISYSFCKSFKLQGASPLPLSLEQIIAWTHQVFFGPNLSLCFDF